MKKRYLSKPEKYRFFILSKKDAESGAGAGQQQKIRFIVRDVTVLLLLFRPRSFPASVSAILFYFLLIHQHRIIPVFPQRLLHPDRVVQIFEGADSYFIIHAVVDQESRIALIF